MTICAPPAPIENIDGNWEKYLNLIYEVFRHDLIENPLIYNNIPVYVDTSIDTDGRERAFWHLIAKEEHSNTGRYPDFRRCEKIAWIHYFLVQCSNHCKQIKIWKKYNPKNNKVRIHIWCEKYDYIIVLEERKNYLFLITAFNVIYQHKKQALEKEYQLWQKTKTPIQ